MRRISDVGNVSLPYFVVTSTLLSTMVILTALPSAKRTSTAVGSIGGGLGASLALSLSWPADSAASASPTSNTQQATERIGNSSQGRAGSSDRGRPPRVDCKSDDSPPATILSPDPAPPPLLVPKLCLGTHTSEAPLRKRCRGTKRRPLTGVRGAKRSFDEQRFPSSAWEPGRGACKPHPGPRRR